MPERPAVTGCVVDLPGDVVPPLRVYVNGDEVAEGDDYRVEGAQLVFERPLVPSREDGFFKRLTMLTAGVGFYGQGDVVDVHYGGTGASTGVASNLPVKRPAT